MLKYHFRIDIDDLIGKVMNKINPLELNDLNKFNTDKFQGIDIARINGDNKSNYFMIISIRLDTLWDIKKRSRKVNIMDLDFKIIHRSNQSYLKDIPVISIKGNYYKYEYGVSEGINIMGYSLYTLERDIPYNINNTLVYFNDNDKNHLEFSGNTKYNFITQFKNNFRRIKQWYQNI